MEISDQVDFFRKKQFSLRQKQKGIDEPIIDTPSFIFGGIIFSKNMDCSKLSSQELMLAHTWVHTSFVYKNPKIPKDDIISIHKKIVAEFGGRGIAHSVFDDLDYA